MNNREGRRQFTFTLYENNSRDREVISFLDKISQSVRGKVIRGFVLEQFFNGTNIADVKDEEKKKTEDLKKLEAKERVSSAKKQIDDDIPNPFDNLNL
jgi:hypothetical protein